MSYVLLDNEQFEKKEKQDKLNLDLFRKAVNQMATKIDLIYKLLEKGADPLFLDGEIIRQVFHQTGVNDNSLELFIHCYEKYDEVKTYVKEMNITVALMEPIRHIGALRYLLNHCQRDLTEKERAYLNNPQTQLVQANNYAIIELNQIIAKKDLFYKFNETLQTKPAQAKSQTLKLKI